MQSLFVCSRNSDRRNNVLQAEEKNEELRHFCLAFASLHQELEKYFRSYCNLSHD